MAGKGGRIPGSERKASRIKSVQRSSLKLDVCLTVCGATHLGNNYPLSGGQSKTFTGAPALWSFATAFRSPAAAGSRSIQASTSWIELGRIVTLSVGATLALARLAQGSTRLAPLVETEEASV